MFHILSDQVFTYAVCDQDEKHFNEYSHALLLCVMREKKMDGKFWTQVNFLCVSYITFCMKNSECYRTFKQHSLSVQYMDTILSTDSKGLDIFVFP